MKRNGYFVFTLIAIMIALDSAAQTGVEKKTLATFAPGETLVYGEDCLILDQSPESVSFVTVVKNGSEKQYYCYGKDGNKIGPVKEPDKSYWAECAGKPVEDCVPDNQKYGSGYEKYIDQRDGSIMFNDTKYGPYGQLILFNMSEGEQSIYAIALTPEKKMLYFDNTGRKVEITGMPEQIIISPDGKTSYVRVKGSVNPFDPDAFAIMADNPDEFNNPKVYLFGIDGSKYGPYTSSSFNDTWFTPSGQWIIYANSEVLLGGKVLFKVDGSVSKCDIWISNTG